MTSERDVRFGALGERPGFAYWNDLVSVAGWLWQDQMLRWAGVWQRVATMEETPERWIADMNELWMGWAQAMMGLGAFPAEWTARRFMNVPTLVFMIDDVAETTLPQSALTNVTAEGLVVAATDLQRLGGTERVPSDKVEVRLRERGNRVEVTLVGLGGTGRPPAGMYTGLAYAYERPVMRPLAVVMLYVAAAGTAPPPNTI